MMQEARTMRSAAPFKSIVAYVENAQAEPRIKMLARQLKEQNKGNPEANGVTIVIREGVGDWAGWFFVDITGEWNKDAGKYSDLIIDKANVINCSFDARKLTYQMHHYEYGNTTSMEQLGSHTRGIAKVLIKWDCAKVRLTDFY